MADINELVKLAKQRLSTSSVDPKLRFLQVTEQVVRGSGITNKDDVKRITKKVRKGVQAASVVASKERAAAKKVSKALRDRISP